MSSYEPTRWIIQGNERKLAAVLLSGSAQSSVIGPGDEHVVRIGSTFAYAMESPQNAQLKRDIARYVSNPVRAFHGKYAASDFTVGAY